MLRTILSVTLNFKATEYYSTRACVSVCTHVPDEEYSYSHTFLWYNLFEGDPHLKQYFQQIIQIRTRLLMLTLMESKRPLAEHLYFCGSLQPYRLHQPR
jgi:hypothetical protein